MLHAPLENLSGNIRLVISGDVGYLLLCKENSPLLYMFLNEPALLELFRDYMESLEDYCFSINDTVECIQEMIGSLHQI